MTSQNTVSMPSEELEMLTTLVWQILRQLPEAVIDNPQTVARTIMGSLAHIHGCRPVGMSAEWTESEGMPNASQTFKDTVATVLQVVTERSGKIAKRSADSVTAYKIAEALVEKHKLQPVWSARA